LKVFVYVFNDYRDAWVGEAKDWGLDYIEACRRYYSEKLKLSLEFKVTVPDTIYPSSVIQGFPEGVEKVFFYSTLYEALKAAKERGFDGAVFVGRYRVQEAYEYSDRGFYSPEGFAYVFYNPPLLTQQSVRSYLFRFSHELAHLLLHKMQNPPIDTAQLDFPPYVYWIDMFEDKYPMQHVV